MSSSLPHPIHIGVDGFVARFVSTLRERVALLRAHGAIEAAATCEHIVSEFDQAFRTWSLAELTVTEASIESGYSAERLRELVREGRLPDQRPPGSGREIRIRRADLPRRPRAATPAAAVEALATRVLAGRR